MTDPQSGLAAARDIALDAARGSADASEAERRAAELAAVIESMTDAVYIGSAAGITIANQPALEQLGYATREELDRAVGVLAEEIQTRDAITGDPIPGHRQAFARALEGESVVQDVIVRHRVTGEDRIVRCAASPVVVDGRVVAAVAVNTDITDRHRAGAERERLLAAERAARAEAESARREAEAANAAKAQFLAATSHELRTPLNAIGGYAQLLQMGLHGPITEAQRDALARIARAQQHLLTLINDILQFARLEAGQTQLQITTVPLGSLCGRIEPLLGPEMASKRIRFTCDVESAAEAGAPLLVRADRDRALQILINLVSNAVKYTEPGGAVAIDTRLDARRVHVRIRDTGCGIAADQHEAIFAPFVQVNRSDASRQGVGLGLAISRDLARRMGGDITVESTPGEGSTFTLSLPRADASS